MTAQVENTPEGYTKAFKDYDVPKLSEPQIKSLIRNFDVTRKYTRIDCRHFKAQS